MINIYQAQNRQDQDRQNPDRKERQNQDRPEKGNPYDPSKQKNPQDKENKW